MKQRLIDLYISAYCASGIPLVEATLLALEKSNADMREMNRAEIAAYVRQLAAKAQSLVGSLGFAP